MPDFQPGIYPDMSEADYHADPCPAPSLSSSIIKLITTKSALHAAVAHPRIKTGFEEDDETPTTAQSIGKVAHALMLGSDDKIAVSPFDSFRTKEAKTWRDEQQAAGVAIVTEDAYERAHRMVEVGRRHMESLGLAFTGHPEVVLAWQDSGVWCRARFDDLPPSMSLGQPLLDYKTTGVCAMGGEYDRHLYEMHFDIQAALYRRGYEHHFGNDREFWFVVQEITPPYELVVHRPHPLGIERGRLFVERAIQVWRECLRTNEWPGYRDRFWTAEPKPWQVPGELHERGNDDQEHDLDAEIGAFAP